MVLLVLFFVPLLLALGGCAALCFKIASLYTEKAELNLLISEMVKAGVSETALDLANDYYRNEEP